MSKSRAILLSLLLGIILVIGFQNCAKKDSNSSSTPQPSVTPDSDFTAEAEYTDPVSRTRKAISAVSNTAPVSFSFYFNSANGWYEQHAGGQCTPTRTNADDLVIRFKTKVAITNCQFSFAGFNEPTTNYVACTPTQITNFMNNGQPLIINVNRFVVTTTAAPNCVESGAPRLRNGDSGTLDLYLNCDSATCQFHRTLTFTKAGEP